MTKLKKSTEAFGLHHIVILFSTNLNVDLMVALDEKANESCQGI